MSQTLPNAPESYRPVASDCCTLPKHAVADALEPLAVIGVGCRFPGGVHDAATYWELLRTGGDAISEVPPSRWSLAEHCSAERSRPGKSYARHGGFLEQIAEFDASFFGISPREAMRMDPQQRLALELAWEAFEDAGIDVATLAGTATSVYVAVSLPEYNSLQVHPEAYALIDSHTGTGLNFSILANRISYQFDLRGPSVAVDTACSGSLVAVHHACQTIWHQGCSMAIAGGVNLNLKPDTFIMHSKASMLSPTGRCRPFDASADGFVRGEGGGLILIKPLAAAMRDGDPIRAVIRGTAVNQDGRTMSLTMPSRDAQIAAIRAALLGAAVQPHQIQYVEAHGPGTLVGDPIEAEALGRALGDGRVDACRLGSVKSNLGHLEAAAGIAGLIKLVLALQHREIPPTLHHSVPNPRIPFDALRLRVTTTLEPWPANSEGAPRLAGINSFGFGGTNAHAVLAEPPQDVERSASAAQPRGTAGRAELLVLSARSDWALGQLAQAFEQRLAKGQAALTDVCFSAQVRRSHHAHRLAVVGESVEALREQLRAYAGGQVTRAWASGRAESTQTASGPVFVFSGMGQQWPLMGKRLIEQEPVFQQRVCACEQALSGEIDWSISEVMSRGSLSIDRTDVAQITIFALQVGLAALWQQWGIQPVAVVGHSVGEVAAAHVAGALSLAEASQVVLHRSRLQAALAGKGSMLAVELSEDEVAGWLHGREDQIAIAAVNGPHSITLAGSSASLREVAEALTRDQRFNRFLNVDVPYHSPLMRPLMDPLVAALSLVRPTSATVPLVSTVTANRIAGTELVGAYWARNIREPVNFARALAVLKDAGYTRFLEISAHPVLATSLKQCLGSEAKVFASLRRGADERTSLLVSLGDFYCSGVVPSARGLYPEGGYCVPLPSHPWQRATHWQEAEGTRRHRLGVREHPLLGRRIEQPQPAWEVEIDLEQLTYLAGHRIQDELVFPYTAYCEMAMAAARQIHGPGVVVLSNLTIERALILDANSPAHLRLEVAADSTTFTIHSFVTGTRSWIRHVQGRLAIQPFGRQLPPLGIDEIRQRCTRVLDGTDCYRELTAFGYAYAPSFQGVHKLWYSAGDSTALHAPESVAEAICELHWPNGIPHADANYITHPAVLDAYLNGVLAVLVRHQNATWLPIRTDESVVYAPLSERAWMHMRVVALRGSLLELDLTIADVAGQISTVVRGMHYRAIAHDAVETQQRPVPLVERWEPAFNPMTTSEWAPNCLVWGHGSGIGQLLAAQIQARGGKAQCIDGLRESLQDLLPQLERVEEVIHVCSLDQGSAGRGPAAAQAFGSKDALAVAQALVRLPRPPRLWIVTRAVHAIVDGQIPEPLHSPLWGLGRVLANEWPSLRLRLVDLQHASSREVEALAAEIFSNSDEPEIAFAEATRHVHRIRRLPTNRTGDDVAYRLVIRQPGRLDGLSFETHDAQVPGPGQVAIDVMAAGLNFKDVVKGLDLIDDLSLSRTYAGRSLGFECAGRVSAVGAGVERIHVGDDVMGLAGHCFATHTVTEAAMIKRIPAGFNFEEAASCPVVYMTAYAALHHFGRLRSGERVLIHTAAGGVGQAAVQIAHAIGAKIYATAGSEEKRSLLRAQGIEHVGDSRSMTFATEILAATCSEGVDLVINTLPARTIPASLSLLRPRGRLVDLSNFYADAQIDLRPFQKGLTLVAFDLDQLMRSDATFLAALFHEAMDFMTRFQLPPPPRRIFPMAQAEDAFRHLAQGHNLGKVVLTQKELGAVTVDASAMSPPKLLRDATYLVTGGTSGFGLSTAGWLVEQGAMHIVLLSRRGLSSAHAENLVADWRRSGVEVTVLCADMGQRREVERALQEIRGSLPPVRGIVHAATVYADELLAQLTPMALDRVLAPKAFGAWALHELTRELSLDFFVLFSSIAATVGNPGQGNYAAANAFLDALADHRHALGLPVTCVAWGGISEVGYLAREGGIASRLAQAGIETLLPRQALRQLGTLMRLGVHRAVVAPMNWQTAGARLESLRTPRFEELVGLVGADASRVQTLTDELAPLDSARQRDLLVSRIAEQAARILGTPREKLDSQAALTQMGLDSLMAVELSQQLKLHLGLDVKSMRLLSGDSLIRIAETLLAQISFESVPHLTEFASKDDPHPAVSQSSSTAAAAQHRPALKRRGKLQVEVPLSFQQLPMWQLQRRYPDAGFYNLPTLARCQGGLNVSALKRAFSALVRRHEALCWKLVEHGDGVIQRFQTDPRFEVEVEDLRALPAHERELALRRRWEVEQVRPFDLTRELPLRARILLLGAEESAWIVVLHHMAGDGASYPILYRDLYNLYREFVEERWTTLTELPVGYGDFALWQQQVFRGESCAYLVSRWRQLLGDQLPFLALPAQIPTRSSSLHEGAHCSFGFTREVTDGLRGLARQEQSTLFMTLLTALGLFIHRITGLDDFALGTFVANRHLPELVNLVGCFVNCVPLRIQTSPELTFRSALGRVRAMVLEAQELAELPFSVLAEHLSAAQPPQVVLILHNELEANDRHRIRVMDGLEVTHKEGENQGAKRDWTFHVFEDQGGLSGYLEYDKERFAATTVGEVVGHFRSLAERLVRMPDELISRVAAPILTGPGAEPEGMPS